MNELVVIVILILINGVLAMSEIAIISVRKSYLSSEVKRGSKAAKIALRLSNDPDKFLSTVQIGITVIGILTGIYSGSVLATDFAVVLAGWGVSASYADTLSQAIIVISVTYTTLIFGELVPKRIGMSIAEQTAKIVAEPMYILSLIASPFVWVLSRTTALILTVVGLKEKETKVTEEEIKSLIQESADDGEVQKVEQDIVERVFMLGDLKVSSLMTPRREVVLLDVNMSVDEVKKIVFENLYEIYPVVDRNPDKVVGVITLKKLFLAIGEGRFNLTENAENPLYFHQNLSVYKALEKMKEQRLSRVLICDEFGGFLGIITLRDILEGLVGSIDDAYGAPHIVKRKDSESWLVDGQCPFYDFLSYFEREHMYVSNGYNTIGGLLLEEFEGVPSVGEIIKWKDFKFEIMDLDGVRIDKVLVEIIS